MISTTPPSTCLLSRSSVDFRCDDQYTSPQYLQKENKAGKLKPLISTHPLPSGGPSSFAAVNSSPRPVDFYGFIYVSVGRCLSLLSDQILLTLFSEQLIHCLMLNGCPKGENDQSTNDRETERY